MFSNMHKLAANEELLNLRCRTFSTFSSGEKNIRITFISL